MNKQEIYAMLARLEEAARQLDDDAIEGEYQETNLITGVTLYHTPAAEQDTAPEPELDQESQEQPEQESGDQDDAQEGQFTEIPDYQDTSIPVYQDTNKSGTRKLLFIFLIIGLIASTAAGSVSYYLYSTANTRATVTIYPDSQTLTRSAIFTNAEISIRSYQTTKTQSKTIATTGVINRPATQAAGDAIFLQCQHRAPGYKRRYGHNRQ